MDPASAPAPMGPAQVALIVLAFLVFFPVMWLGVTGLLSVLGGWRSLASYYPAGPAAAGGRAAARYATGAMRRGLLPVNYSHCLAVDPREDGFGLWVALPFRFMHPPLLIPWTAVRDCEERGVVWRYVRVTLHTPGVTILIGGRSGRAVQERWMRFRAAAAGSNAMLAHPPAR